MHGLSVQIKSLIMTRSRRRNRAKRGGSSETAPLGVRTVTSEFESEKVLATGGVDIGGENFSGLKLALASVMEWRVRTVRVTYEPTNPMATGRVLLLVSPEDWDDLSNVASMVASGAISTAACARKVSPTTSVASADWFSRNKAAAKVHVVLSAVTGTPGFLRVLVTYQTRGVTIQ